MALQAPVFTAALALIVVNNKVVGHMRNIRYNENTRRVQVRGLGTILPQEAPVTEWSGSLSCSFFELNYKIAGLSDAIRRDVGVGNTGSLITPGGGGFPSSFEDNLVLDTEGITVHIYKKVKDAALSPTPGGPVPLHRANSKTYAVLHRCLIESDNVTIDEGNVVGRDQTFTCLDPVVYTANDSTIAD